MDIYRNDNTDPAFNLAAEEYLADSYAGDGLFMLWRNAPSVIIGRNQNAYAELDLAFAEKHGIKVVRRLTGGGAVFHDLGNVNYTFISRLDDAGTLNFPRFCGPVIEALRGLGVDAELSGRNDITVGGRKVSGTAQCVRGGRVLHHGTLLWSADFSYMEKVLRPDPSKLQSKGIKSVGSRVANLRDLLPEGAPLSRDSGAADLMDYLFSRFGGEPLRFTDGQTEAIAALAEKKYSSWEWNMGSSRGFSCRRSRRFPFGRVEVAFDADRGLITSVSVSGDFFGTRPVSGLEARLTGVRPEYAAVLEAVPDAGEFISGATAADLAGLIAGSPE
jgi:lipoate-protein ligase A